MDLKRFFGLGVRKIIAMVSDKFFEDSIYIFLFIFLLNLPDSGFLNSWLVYGGVINTAVINFASEWEL